MNLFRIFHNVLAAAILFSALSPTVFAITPGDVLWRADIGATGSYTGTDGTVWNLSNGNSYHNFTSVFTDGSFVYTGRAYKDPWYAIGDGSVQVWTSDGLLLESSQVCSGCRGVYNMSLQVYNGDGLGLMRLFVYKPGKLEIRDKDTLAIIAGSNDSMNDTTAPDCSSACNAVGSPTYDDSIVKRTSVRSDGITFYAEQTNNAQVFKPLVLYADGTPLVTESSWVTEKIPAPAWYNGNIDDLYTGVEAIALDPGEISLYLTGGRYSGGYVSRLEKRALPPLGAPAVFLSANTTSLPKTGGNIAFTWSSIDADVCNITSSPLVWSGAGLPPNGSQSPIGITVTTIFTGTCTRNSDGAAGSDTLTITVAPNQLPVPVVTNPPGDVAAAAGTPISFDGTNSYDPDGSITAYDWRDGGCLSGTPLSSSASFTKSDFTPGTHSVYLAVRDSDNDWSASCVLRTVYVPPRCNNGGDDDSDNLIDASDPGCWTDPTNSSTYNPNDNSETNCGDGICTKADGESLKSCRLDCKAIFREQ